MVEQCIVDEDVDMIVFGCFWIINLDLLVCFVNDYLLVFSDDMSCWYGGGVEGYLDYFVYKVEQCFLDRWKF